MRVVAFKTDFREEWSSPPAPPPGEALAQTVRDDVHARGSECDDVDLHEEFGWAWVQRARDTSFYVLLTQHAGLPDHWLIQVEAQRRLPFLRRPVHPQAELDICRQIHSSLTAHPNVDAIRWFETLEQVSNSPDEGQPEP